MSRVTHRFIQAPVKPVNHGGSDKSLSIGFILCLVLTISAYIIVQAHGLVLPVKIGLVAGLAFIQFAAQLFFFLHLGQEKKPRWKLWMFFAMMMIVLTVVVGSLWIMHNLDYNMMNLPAAQKEQYVKDNEGL